MSSPQKVPTINSDNIKIEKFDHIHSIHQDDWNRIAGIYLS